MVLLCSLLFLSLFWVFFGFLFLLFCCFFVFFGGFKGQVRWPKGPLQQNSTSRNHIQPRCQKLAVLKHPTSMSRNSDFRNRRAQLEQPPKPSKDLYLQLQMQVDSGATRRWVVGQLGFGVLVNSGVALQERERERDIYIYIYAVVLLSGPSLAF